MTFSIAARCERTGMLGVAVASASLACGSAAPYVKTSIGAIASQAAGNPFLGIDGLRLLSQGLAPTQVIADLLPRDPGRELRQLLIVDGRGRTAAFTGAECLNWAGHHEGDGYVVGGNRLTDREVVVAMGKAFEHSSSEELPEHLVHALEAGDAAGGDRRGRQSAGLLVYYDQDYRHYDLRVDDHPDPVKELRRIFELKKADRAKLGDWRPTRESPLEPGFLEKWPQLKADLEREAAEVP